MTGRLGRLASMLGADEGFYVLALHSFVEAFATERFPDARYERVPFGELATALAEQLRGRGSSGEEGYRALVRIAKEHALTHQVRHAFAEVGKEVAAAATHNFLSFCAAFSISDPALGALRKGLHLWDEKTSPLERSEELKRMRLHLTLAEREREALLGKLGEYDATRVRLEHVDGVMGQLRRELAQEKERAAGKDERLDETRQELNRLRMERKDLVDKLEGYAALEQYVSYLDQFSLYTRTRRDYESGVMVLTPEQRMAVEAMDLGHDFLIKGAAGTGKTLVLLHALGKARRERAEELGIGPRGRIVLLTYTTTLVKYDRYLAEVMRGESGEETIATADSYLVRKLAHLEPGIRVDYGLARQFCRDETQAGRAAEFLAAEELVTEIEDFLLGNDVSREEYVDSRMLRRGLRQPLSAAQRARVWEVRERFVERMERERVVSKNWSRIMLIRRLMDGSGAEAVRDADLIFLDESQDLCSVDLTALRLLARRALIMAGDTDQSIYGVGSPYARAGIEITGRTRILHTNFRNTCAIHDLAERYRLLAGEGRHDATSAPQAFREGPVPEIATGAAGRALLDRLLARAELFVKTLSYDPENVCILAPTNEELGRIGEALRARGYSAANIRDEGFSFHAPGTIRLSTLHSAKGLDFPVVLMYLPALPSIPQYDERSADKLLRNLVYVGMTRAMDNLNVFTVPEPKEPALQDLVRAFGEG